MCSREEGEGGDVPPSSAGAVGGACGLCSAAKWAVDLSALCVCRGVALCCEGAGADGGAGEGGRPSAQTKTRSHSHKHRRQHTNAMQHKKNCRRRRRRRRGRRGRRAAALPAAAAVPPRRGRGAAEGPAARARAAAGGEGARRERGGREERAGALPAALWRALRARPPLSLAHSASKTRPKTHPEKHNPNCQTHNTRQTNTNRQVAWESAEDIASEVLALVCAAAPHIRAQWAWAGALNLLKMTSVKREAFPISLEVRAGAIGSARQADGRPRSGAARRPARRRQRVDRVRPRHPKRRRRKQHTCACKKQHTETGRRSPGSSTARSRRSISCSPPRPRFGSPSAPPRSTAPTRARRRSRCCRRSAAGSRRGRRGSRVRCCVRARARCLWLCLCALCLSPRRACRAHTVSAAVLLLR